MLFLFYVFDLFFSYLAVLSGFWKFEVASIHFLHLFIFSVDVNKFIQNLMFLFDIESSEIVIDKIPYPPSYLSFLDGKKRILLC